MKIKAIEELMLICDMETDGSKVGWRKRREAMESWISKYVEVIETRQSVLNPQYFDSQFMDFIK